MNANIYKNKKILITGGTGSFGSSFLKQLVNYKCKITIFSRDELKQYNLRNQYDSKNIDFVIGDVRNFDSVDKVMKNVDFVFHAAALKQVPSCEFFPVEAVNTNVIGSHNVIQAAIRNNVSKLIALSTDKSVYPLNAMGLTKSLMEKIIISESKVNIDMSTDLILVRYGNVMFSRGSVIPLIIKNIKENKSIPITNSEMTRFLIPLEKAINLVSYAIKYGKNGEILIHKSNACNILDLAEVLIDIFKSKSKIKIIGKRKGEKIHEILATKEELQNSLNKKEYIIIKNKNKLNYDEYFKKGFKVHSKITDLSSANTDFLNKKKLKEFLLSNKEFQNHLK